MTSVFSWQNPISLWWGEEGGGWGCSSWLLPLTSGAEAQQLPSTMEKRGREELPLAQGQGR